jgi:ABC-type phosphate transport system substrate-binding protein
VAKAETVTILESGSSLLYPLFNLWVDGYAKVDPNVRITTQSTGSGTGIAQAIKGLAQIGASDAYMAGPQVRRNPGMMNIPLALSAQNVIYNLPGLNDRNLKFSGPVLADIYSGKITSWDDPAIVALNPGLPLPKHAITAIRTAAAIHSSSPSISPSPLRLGPPPSPTAPRLAGRPFLAASAPSATPGWCRPPPRTPTRSPMSA